ncbi:MAG: N-acetylmuramic acid 6-phosphate etherase [Bacteroidetes bacterium]|nr:N-acetylmuramic acid 6-phosphate etherase [Bacteroidota bacterium]
MHNLHSDTESGRGDIKLEDFSADEIAAGMLEMDAALPDIIRPALSSIAVLIDKTAVLLANGGRLFYLGAGTSGRLGILDASECPPTFGVPHGLVVGMIAGGDSAIRRAVEFAEDDVHQGFRDLMEHEVSSKDLVLGISASGRTPYVLGALQACKAAGITTACICCNIDTIIGREADFPVEVQTGAEFVTGSTRLKAGTATKMILNMISTGTMIRLGKVQGTRMVDMQLSNHKLVDRGTRMLHELTGLNTEAARALLLEFGNVRAALAAWKAQN